MLALAEDRFLTDCRKQLITLHEILMQELSRAVQDQKSQAGLLVEIRQCEEAIKRIDTGHFGRCKVCSEAIELNRLKAEPTVTTCLSCAADRHNS